MFPKYEIIELAKLTCRPACSQNTVCTKYERLYLVWHMKPKFQFSNYSQRMSCNNFKMFTKTKGVWKVQTFEILRSIEIEALPRLCSITQDKLAKVFTMGTSRLIAKFPNNLIAKCKLSLVGKAAPHNQHSYSKQRHGVTVSILLGTREITAATSRLGLTVVS